MVHKRYPTIKRSTDPRIDLYYSYDEGMNLLQIWRNQYSKSEYLEQVILNMFCRKYTMEFMWNKIINCFQKNIDGDNKMLWKNFNTGFRKLKLIYQKTSESKTLPIISSLISVHTERKVGSVSYSDYTQILIGAQQGNNEDVEKIEHDYLHNLLTDDYVLLWSAFGGTGLDKIEAIREISGFYLGTPEIETYEMIEYIVGRFCATLYLDEINNHRPPF